MAMTPHVRCAHCDHVFPSDAGPETEVTCPACGRSGTPAGVMRPSGVPSLEVFRSNVESARRRERNDG
jgi:rubredoxin